MAHTPGNWQWEGDEGPFRVGRVRYEFSVYRTMSEQQEGVRLVDVRRVPGGEAEAYANARLIAAAPDLLEVCRFILDLEDSGGWAGPTEVIKPLRAAIAKAVSA